MHGGHGSKVETSPPQPASSPQIDGGRRNAKNLSPVSYVKYEENAAATENE
jgi:hypothetical protein